MIFSIFIYALSKCLYTLITATTVYVTVFQLAGGVIADKLGARRVFATAVFIDGTLSLLIPVATRWHYIALIAVRAGIGMAQVKNKLKKIFLDKYKCFVLLHHLQVTKFFVLKKRTFQKIFKKSCKSSMIRINLMLIFLYFTLIYLDVNLRKVNELEFGKH